MRPKPTLAMLTLLLATISVAGWTGGQDTAQPLTPLQKRQIAVSVLRVINTAEVSHLSRNGRFATLSEFTPTELDTSRARYSNPAMPSIDPASSDPVPGFNLRIMVAADGQSYSVKLSDKQRGNCGTDAFTDDAGLIYLAGPIDCNFATLQPYVAEQGSTAAPAESGATPMMVRVSAGVAEANLLSRVDPVYPPVAQQARLQGTVVQQIVIDTNGNVTNIRVISGHPMLVQAAIDAVRQWRYKPYLLNGAAVAVSAQVQVNFTLGGAQP